MNGLLKLDKYFYQVLSRGKKQGGVDLRNVLRCMVLL